MDIIKPPRLKPGDTIGIAAPASPFELELFGQGRALLESQGFETVCPDGIYRRERYLAGDDAGRAERLNRLFLDPGVRAIICARGGFGSMRVLDLLDFDRIRANPKILVGFSDISALLNVIHARCGVVGLHGPVVTSLAGTERASIDALVYAVSADGPISLTAATVLRSGRATAPVVGGNLTTLCHLTGTEYAQQFSGRILFLEDVNEAPYRIDRMLSQMRMAGCFDGLAGLALGAFTDCGSEEDLAAIVEDVFSEEDMPIVSGFDIGHGPVNLAVPVGLPATLDTEDKRLVFHEPATMKE
jgi:muramoyltetrapeptide carboxypeptidase